MPATLSSGMTIHSISAICEKAITSGADLDPGESTTFSMPFCLQISAINATAFFALFMDAKMMYLLKFRWALNGQIRRLST
jgi:hypothetical protein